MKNYEYPEPARNASFLYCNGSGHVAAAAGEQTGIQIVVFIRLWRRRACMRVPSLCFFTLSCNVIYHFIPLLDSICKCRVTTYSH
ncbi:hypothetical protein OIU85_026896 [Salix viminalis]|uniref:Uncharacterized protein n=1 Tax=Salix viminalis TaxID=40686 RepID=A0A9Q0TPJ7_SALVM|nr:hypothetical protein OIU85_026896 [Salix viminalis]